MNDLQKFVRVHINYYRVAPKTCPARNSLAAIVACSRELNASGLGIRVKIKEWRDPETGKCRHEIGRPFWNPHCSACWEAIKAAADERREIVDDITERFDVGTHGNGLCRDRHPVFIHIQRGNLKKDHVALAKRVLSATARAFRKRGYEVVADGAGE